MVAVPPTSIAKVAKQLDREFEGEPDLEICGVASLVSASRGDLVFARAASFLEALAPESAAIVIAPVGVDVGGRAAIRSPHPELDFSRALEWLLRERRPPAGIDVSASVADSAELDPSASVGPRVVIAERVHVGARSELHAGATIGSDVVIGSDCIVHPGAVVREGARIGDRVWIHSNAVIGNEGYGYTFDESGRPSKIPQVGHVIVEDDAEIGAGTVVQRGSLDATRIAKNAKIGDLCVIGHNSEIGEDVMMIGHSAIAGSVCIERGVIIMGQVAIGGHLTIGAGALIGARAGIHKDVRPRARMYGVPGVEERAWHRSTAALGRLPELFRRVREIERKVGAGGDDDERDA